MRMGTAGGAEFGERPMTSNKVGADLIAAGVPCDTVKEEQHLWCVCHCRSLYDLVGSWQCCIASAVGSQEDSYRGQVQAQPQPGRQQGVFLMSGTCW